LVVTNKQRSLISIIQYAEILYFVENSDTTRLMLRLLDRAFALIPLFRNATKK